VREIARVLTHLQHQYPDAIVCTTHVHLDEHNCMEVLVVRGSAAEVQAIADKLISTRGVKHGKLVCTTTGRSLV
jgi:CopG family nickel-responsive transcriptional regulator